MHEIIFATVAAVITGVVTWLSTSYRHSRGRTDIAFKFAMQQCTLLQQRVDMLENQRNEQLTNNLNQARRIEELARQLDQDYNPSKTLFAGYRHLPFPVWVCNVHGHTVFVNLCFEQEFQTNLLRVQQQPGPSIWPEEVANIFNSQQTTGHVEVAGREVRCGDPDCLGQAISEENPLQQWRVTMSPIALPDQIYGAVFIGYCRLGRTPLSADCSAYSYMPMVSASTLSLSVHDA